MRAPLRYALTTATALLLTCAGALAALAPASATVTRLCLTYSGCEKAGMGHAGYAQANRVMYWRMYSGHNCTNYVAYRLVKNGMPNVRPWDGSGNATNWGVAMAKITDSTPTVGSVAWWRAGVYPAGSSGHVAYVERVVSADEIIVSQDSWGGEFSWARITRGSKGWPSGFIHFNDKKTTVTKIPKVKGAARVGATLTATAGTWSPADVTTSLQWRVAGKDVKGATSSTYQVRPADLGKRVRVVVTATRSGYPTATVMSRRTAVVGEAALVPTAVPSVTGDAVVGGTLTATTGTWDPVPASHSYQWLVGGVAVPGAQASTFAPRPEHLGKTVTVQVTARKDGFEPVTATSRPTGAVQPGTLAVAPPALADSDGDGKPTPGETLTVTPGTVPGASAPKVVWLRGTTPVAGATATKYAVTAADLGQPLTVRLVWSRPGYKETTVEASTGRPVKAVPTVGVAAAPGKRTLGLTVSVTAAGVTTLPGRVRVVSGGKVLGKARAATGKVVLQLTGLAPGTRTYRIVYTGGRDVRRTVVRHQLTVR
ncbi:CHAP domain-containing protein [Nocardioides caldifontis]|uniref:CHAP domain-containing protein n=1 Tax=Nocardioides caldifontis TaxID=2588938 RepID=UPI0011E02125|nr:CHAP domain-containing protein [Nocardioides caldifontis]